MKTILLVEDDAQLSRALVRLLNRAGHNVVAVNNGDTAITTFEQTPVDLLIVDMYIPGKDGYEVIDACRRIRPDLPVMGISDGGGYADPHSLLSGARELGAMVTIPKPFTEEELLSVVEQMFAVVAKNAPRRHLTSNPARKPRHP